MGTSAVESLRVSWLSRVNLPLESSLPTAFSVQFESKRQGRAVEPTEAS